MAGRSARGVSGNQKDTESGSDGVGGGEGSFLMAAAV